MELHRENYKYSVQRFENVGFMFLYQSKVKLLQSYLTCNSFFELFYFPSAIWKHKNCSIVSVKSTSDLSGKNASAKL